MIGAMTWNQQHIKPKKTTRRDEIFLFIAEYATEHHNAPSTLEIARQFKIAQQTVYHHMLHLMADGRLTQKDGKWKLVGAEYTPPDSA